MNTAFAIPAFGPVLPEIILAAGVLVLVLFGAIRGERSAGTVNILSLALLGAAFIAVLMLPSERVETMAGSFIIDTFAKFMKSLTLIASAAGIILALDFMRRARIERFEYPILILLSTIGMMMVISSNDLIALYLGLELLSLSSYVIAAFDRDNLRSTEAGLKYFVLGALSSGMLLYGASLVYGFTGSVSFPTIAATVQGNAGFGLIFGLVFVAAGIAFKISAVPFHMWTPDVYEGAPTPVTAFFAAAPKMAGMAMATRVFIDAFPGIVGQWQQIIVFIAIASMALGSFAAIGQRNIKRLMAYSSIGNVGFALVGLATGTAEGIQGVVIYMAIYLAMTLGTFAVILSMRRGDQMFETIEDLSGLSRTHPLMAFCLAMMMFSLAGIPPLAGFFAKFAVFTAAINANLVTLAVIGVVTSVIGAYYYLRIVKVMYFDDAVAAYEPMPAGRPLRARGLQRVRGALRPRSLRLSRRPRAPLPAHCSDVRLAPETQSAGYRFLSRDATESTNDDAVAAAKAGDPGQLWVVAGEQRAGRGRHGRQWSSPPGNLYASLLLVDPCEPAIAPQLGFVAGLALHDAVESLTGIGAPRLALKWPNDLLLDGAKTSGLLLEGHRVGPNPSLAIVIGFGINVSVAPSARPIRRRPCAMLRPHLQVEDVFAALSTSFAQTFAAWRQAARMSPSDPFGAIRRLWLERAAGIGQSGHRSASLWRTTGHLRGARPLGPPPAQKRFRH